jgi:hypothetical protein
MCCYLHVCLSAGVACGERHSGLLVDGGWLAGKFQTDSLLELINELLSVGLCGEGEHCGSMVG